MLIVSPMDNKDGGYEFYVSPKGDPNFRSAYFFQPDKPYNKDGPGQLIAYDYGYDRIDATNLKNAVELAKKNYSDHEGLTEGRTLIISKEKLRKIILEAVSDSDQEMLDHLRSLYSDMHKDVHDTRYYPDFKTVDQAQRAIERLRDHIAIEIAHQEEDRRRDEFEQEIESLRPGDYDIESPKYSGMRRRQESIRRRLKKIINEDRF